MKRLINVLMLCCVCAGLMLQYYGCASSIELNSRKTNQPVVIDGSEKDWQGASTNLENQKVSLGFFHDETSLYVLLTTYDQQTQGQIMGTGMTVWFDSTGSKNKIVGVHFPMGMTNEERPRRDRSDQKGSNQRIQPEQMQKMSETVNAQLELIYPEIDQKKQILLPSSEGYNAKLGLRDGKLICELQIPLSAVGDRGVAGVGFETPEISRPQTPPKGEAGGPGGGGQGGPPGGGMPPDGGGPGGGGMAPGGGSGGRGMPPGERGSIASAKPLDLWVQVNLNPVLPEKK
jgi:hypothetical protein